MNHDHTPRAGSVRYRLAGRFRRLHVVAWGDPAAPPVLCLHGLTRTGRDFDDLARRLADRFHVIAPDLPGRGGSEWLDDPKLYRIRTYVAALAHLVAGFEAYDIVGTSLGGICGMALAATPGGAVRRLVLNDIGPHLPAAAMARIAAYAAAPMPRFTDLDAAERHLRAVHAPFGRLTDAQWRHLATHSVRRLDDGDLALHYDPAIALNVASGAAQPARMWPWWNAIAVPILTLRGEHSDLLPPATLARMAGKSRTLTVHDTGHAPALMDPATMGAIEDFLAQEPVAGSSQRVSTRAASSAK